MCSGSSVPGNSTTCNGNRGNKPGCMLLLWLSRAACRQRVCENMILKLKRTPAIYLVGFMGCGKSTVGRALADELGWAFFDLDEEIERREKTSIAEIFDGRGEESFREIETAALRERVHAVQSGRPQGISLGGGPFLREGNFDLLPNHALPASLDPLFSPLHPPSAP